MTILHNKPTITRKELEGVLDCLISDRLEAGETVKNFERILSELISTKFTLATSSLTAAYHLSFLSLDCEPGDEIIMPSFFHAAPLSACSLIGVNPVLVDVDENSMFPSPKQILERIGPKTKALVIGHYMGFTQPLEQYNELGIPLIEDISHAIGTEINEKPAGSYGSLTVASFAPSMIITTGNGGLVATGNSRLYSRLRDFRGNGKQQKQLSFEYCMTDFQGAMGQCQLQRLQDFLARRRDIAKTYYSALKGTSHKTLYAYNDSFAYQSFPVMFDASADKIVKYWKKSGIELERATPIPIHSLLESRPMDYPNSERLSKKLYSLPVYPTLTKKEVDKIANSLGKFV